jgi:hypothetical protein
MMVNIQKIIKIIGEKDVPGLGSPGRTVGDGTRMVPRGMYDIPLTRDRGREDRVLADGGIGDIEMSTPVLSAPYG